MFGIHKWLLALFVVVAIGAYVFYHERRPCVRPIAYSIGTVDARFGISREQFKDDINEAASLWSDAWEKQLFVYDPSAALKINLVYDARQRLTTQEQSLMNEISDLRAQITSTDAEIATLKTQYASAHGVEKNTLADRLNTKITTHNQLAAQINGRVQKINTDGLAGTRIEEGVYVSNEKGESITIYQFDNRIAFIRVIAHELGHALGLDHNNNPTSIMSPVNVGTTIALMQDDFDALSELCKN